MSKIYPITLTITPGEKAMGLYEINEQSPGSRGIHRYQVILVNRNDKLAEFIIDMGKEELWRNKRFINIPAVWEHSVSELQFIADQIRDESTQDELDIMALLDNDGKIKTYF